MLKDHLAVRIRLARGFAGQSQITLAKRIGVGRSAIANWECGRAQPSTTHMVQLARSTGVCFEWLAMGQGAVQVAADSSQQITAGLSHEEGALLQAFRTASRKRQQQILYIALSLSTSAAGALADLLAVGSS